MAVFSTVVVLLLLLSLSLSLSNAAAPKPRALLLQVAKDPSTLQYLTQIKQRTPLTPVTLAVNLGSRYTWIDCDHGYVSSTKRAVPCSAAPCAALKSKGCSTGAPSTCSVFPYNPFKALSTPGDLSEDVVSVRSTDGFNPKAFVTVPRVVFSCGPNSLVEGLARQAMGIAAFGRTPVALPAQFSSALGFPKKFAVCLPSSSSGTATGVIFFGDMPYKFLPDVVLVPQSLIYTPLVTNPVSTEGVSTEGEPSYEYFIRVKSIQVNGKTVPVRPSLLTIDKKGVGGTKISTVIPYTVLESSIYKAVVDSFTTATAGLKKVASAAPFGACYDAANVSSTRVGPGVPTIDLMVDSKNGFWRMFGANSMVEARPGVLCLGFVDGGASPRTSIVIGGHQLENNLLQFDLAGSRLGFSGTLLFRQTTCSNFNFTAAP